MSNLSLLKERSELYESFLLKLKHNKIAYKKNLLVYELAIYKSDLLKLKKFVKQYLIKSIDSYNESRINNKDFNLIKNSKLILDLPNITPNGVIVPKKENFLEYVKIQKFIINLMRKNKLIELASKIELCEVRLMRSNKHNYESKRSYSSTKIHSDSWSGNPCDSKIVIFIDGDKNNSIEFFKPRRIDKNFFLKKKNYDIAIKKYGYRRIKKLDTNKITIFDQACLHRTINFNRNLRLSLDFGIIIDNKRKRFFSKRYKNRFLDNKNISIIKLKKALKPKSIHDKF